MEQIEQITKIFQGKQKKSHLFDPINLMFKYAIVYISGPGTKLSYTRHIITVQKPEWSQGLLRYYDERDDIHLILKALIDIINRYHAKYIDSILEEKNDVLEENNNDNKDNKEDVEEENIDDDDGNSMIKSPSAASCHGSESGSGKTRIKNRFYKSPKIKTLLEFMIKGLDVIQKYYEEKYGDGMFIPGIQYMMNLLYDGMEGKIPLNRLPVKYRKPDTISLININEILKLWDDKKIQKLLNLLNDAEKYIKSTMNTSSLEWNEALTSGETRQILDGYISSMMPTLEEMDKKFQKIVEKSIA
jgi:hypothetical protein